VKQSVGQTTRSRQAACESPLRPIGEMLGNTLRWRKLPSVVCLAPGEAGHWQSVGLSFIGLYGRPGDTLGFWQ